MRHRRLLLSVSVSLLCVPLLSGAASAAPSAVPQPPVATGPGILGTGLRVSDLDRSIQFYTAILGMTVAGRLPHGSLTEVMLTFGEARGPSIILMKDEAPGKSPPIVAGNGFDKIVLDMPDLASLIARMKQAGIPVGEVHGSMGVKVLFITDPDGYRYELIERSAPKVDAPKG